MLSFTQVIGSTLDVAGVGLNRTGTIQSINIVVGNFVIPKMQASRQNIDPAIGMLAFSIWSLLWGIPGAILAYPLTLTLMIAFAQFETTRWVAVLISNDGKPAASLEAEAEASSSAGPADFVELP